MLCIPILGINLKSINSLDNKLKKSIPLKDSGELDPLHIFYIEKEFNTLEGYKLKNAIYTKYPALRDIEGDLSSSFEYHSCFDDLSKRIVLHNKKRTILIPSKQEYLEEKKAYLIWRGYNTPSVKDVTITPLHGTMYAQIHGLDIYNQWKVATYMLILEYDILFKAKMYMDNKYNKTLSLHEEFEYGFAYDNWKNRQLYINYINLEGRVISSESSLLDFNLETVLYLEICEDILYVMLNIILAKTIIDNINLENYSNNSSKFYSDLNSIIDLHYNNNKEEYRCLKELRLYRADNMLSWYDLNQYYLEINNK